MPQQMPSDLISGPIGKQEVPQCQARAKSLESPEDVSAGLTETTVRWSIFISCTLSCVRVTKLAEHKQAASSKQQATSSKQQVASGKQQADANCFALAPSPHLLLPFLHLLRIQTYFQDPTGYPG